MTCTVDCWETLNDKMQQIFPSTGTRCGGHCTGSSIQSRFCFCVGVVGTNVVPAWPLLLIVEVVASCIADVPAEEGNSVALLVSDGDGGMDVLVIASVGDGNANELALQVLIKVPADVFDSDGVNVGDALLLSILVVEEVNDGVKLSVRLGVHVTVELAEHDEVGVLVFVLPRVLVNVGVNVCVSVELGDGDDVGLATEEGAGIPFKMGKSFSTACHIVSVSQHVLPWSPW